MIKEQSRSKSRSSQPEASVLKLRVCDYPNPTRQRGIEFLRFESISKNPSLTRRVMIIPCVSNPLIPSRLAQRNFKKRQRAIYGDIRKRRQRNPSLTFRVGISRHGNIGKY